MEENHDQQPTLLLTGPAAANRFFNMIAGMLTPFGCCLALLIQNINLQHAIYDILDDNADSNDATDGDTDHVVSVCFCPLLFFNCMTHSHVQLLALAHFNVCLSCWHAGDGAMAYPSSNETSSSREQFFERIQES